MKLVQRVGPKKKACLLPNRYGMWLAFLFIASVVGVSKPAMADFNVWYYDDNLNYEYGDVSAGSTLMTPPAWACGVRFDTASYYRWVGEDATTLDSDNFYKDVRVWLPIAGCPYTNSVVIEYTDGSKTFEPVLGAYHMEISTNYGRRWMDENGTWSSCSICTGPSQFQIDKNDWDKLIATFANLKQVRTPSQLEFDAFWSKADQALAGLRKMVFGASTERGRDALGDRGIDVTVLLERRLELSLDDTADLLAQCREDQNFQSRAESTYRSCEMAMDSAIAAQDAWHHIAEETK